MWIDSHHPRRPDRLCLDHLTEVLRPQRQAENERGVGAEDRHFDIDEFRPGHGAGVKIGHDRAAGGDCPFIGLLEHRVEGDGKTCPPRHHRDRQQAAVCVPETDDAAGDGLRDALGLVVEFLVVRGIEVRRCAEGEQRGFSGLQVAIDGVAHLARQRGRRLLHRFAFGFGDPLKQDAFNEQSGSDYQ